MTRRSVEAYELVERVRNYDADMEIMHPLRRKMLDLALEVLPFSDTQAIRALDLGVGTGLFTQRLLESYPQATVVAVDGAAAMIDLAKARLGPLAERVEWVVADFLHLPDSVLVPDRLDVVVSSYALHHLDARQKLSVLKACARALRPGGWLLNADLIRAETDRMEARIQKLRVAAVMARAPAGDARFQTPEQTRAFLDRLEADEQDQPQTLSTDLRIAREAGFTDAEVLWREYREAVVGGSIGHDEGDAATHSFGGGGISGGG